ncbi:lipocalin-like domain-containing protein [Methylocapsa palsarum]|uniref:Lipocalin-like domain-containing protein n=1 Tax=Methylocapsa palsarum TaxID=1612308 RepID=A0A1I3VS71_9HYPH|nr:lipocalin-like domain-containing protein [Methylocapsa palsarum]SFJ98075.1 Lipocalin-like domain-containing protein [Methylocapsa palsarum]
MPRKPQSKIRAALIAFCGLCALAAGVRAAALAPGDIVGTWRIVSYVHKDAAGETSLPMGAHPNGVLIVGADRRCTLIVVAEGRKAAHDEEGYAELAKTMIGYSAPFTDEAYGAALKVTLHPDVSWNETMTGASLVRFVSLEDGKLVVRSPPGPNGAAVAKFERAR